MFSKQTVTTIVVILTVLLITGYVTYLIRQNFAEQNSDAALTLGTDESVSYTTFTGELVELEKFDNSVRVVNSWASWSPFSRQELIDLDHLAAQYKNEGVNVIAINRNEDPVRAQLFVDKLGEITNVHFLIDGGDAFYKRMDGKAMPETLFFNRAGEVVYHARGNLNYEQMEAALKSAMQTD